MLSSFILLPLIMLALVGMVGPRMYNKRILGAIGVGFLSQIVTAILGAADLAADAEDRAAKAMGLTLSADAISLVVLASIGVAAIAALTALWYWTRDRLEGYRLLSLFLLSVTAMNATVLTTDLFTLYVFVEIVAVTSFIMIAFTGEGGGLEGAFKYLVLSAVASVLMLSGLAILFMNAGTLSFGPVAGFAREFAGTTFVKTAVVLFVVGALIKSGMVPFHGWLPDAYQGAPAPASVLLAGIITKASGVYVLIRVVLSVFGLTHVGPILAAAGLVSIIVGALGAIAQKNLKRMLAYSSISQIGYIVLGVSCGSALALAGALFHLFNHAIFKSLLFCNAAHIEKRTSELEMDKLGGLDGPMKTTSWSSLIGFLSTAGVPPFSGFWSKLLIIWGLWSAHQTFSALTALLASLLTAAYFLKMQRGMFWTSGRRPTVCGKACAGLALAEVGLAAVTAALGVGFPYLIGTVLIPLGRF